MRITTDGKRFALGPETFTFRGVTYGTFRPRHDGERLPDHDQVKQDFMAMRDAGFTVVRTYTAPPDDVVALAGDWGLRLLAGVFFPDWRYLIGSSRRQQAQMARHARAEVRATARRLAGREEPLGLCLGNEIPADVVRWVGTRTVVSLVDDLVEVVREEDPDALVTYANYPTTEYLPLHNLDFLTFNVFLERPADFRKYLTRLHHLAGDRPLVLGEIGAHVEGPAGEQHQADFIDWTMETALERGVAGTCVFSWTDEWWVGDHEVEGWRFGLTREDRSPRPALEMAARWNGTTVADLRDEWLTISVVICAYNAEATLDECLRHTCALGYPGLEVIVVDDGSTDATASIVGRHPRARLVSIQHGGLAVARNEGFRVAHGELIAYLDSDAYPSSEWPYFLALGMDGRTVGGVGGPNVPPRDDPASAQRVAHAPGGPVHVLTGDDRAEHVPGCNMAFWKSVLTEVGGFDPIYTAAGDDVDLCWKVLDRGWEISFHPAALVWHHRRAGVRAYLRQQRGYGRAEALVEARHPDRFTPIGTARWRGRIYSSFVPYTARQRVYRGLYGAAAYQSVYRAGGYGLDVAHQIGVPVALLVMALIAPMALVRPDLAWLASAPLLLIAVLAGADLARAQPPRSVSHGRFRFRALVAWLHLLQPLFRTWGRLRNGAMARRDLPRRTTLPGPIQRLGRGVVLLPEDRPRSEIASTIVAELRRAGLRALTPTGWEDHDARVIGSALVTGRLVTSGHPVGCVHVRVRPRLRAWRIAGLAAAVSVLVGMGQPEFAAVLAAAGAADVARGLWRVGPMVPRVLRRSANAAAEVIGAGPALPAEVVRQAVT